MAELKLLISEPGIDDEILEDRAQVIRRELLETGIGDVRLDRGGAIPAGGKGDPVAVGTLVVSLASTAAATAFVTGSLRVLRAFIERRAGRVVIIERNGERVELKGGSAQEDERLVRRLFPDLPAEGADGRHS
ncbi:hypothetical protein ABZS29_06520 [Kribbella sp. NPDC005582]|uniref:effector-associated constant component EACC1 n=1 Tax=Kribbella sp. NPDC005582 TaxID=3156893 RepID=UPI0033B2F6EF